MQSLESMRARLRRARELLEDRPASAATLAQHTLDELNELEQSRQDSQHST
jgi:hypothetical protein